MSEKTFDSKCLDLARHFLQDEACRDAGDDRKLADVIQFAVEDWLDGRNCPHGAASQAETADTKGHE